jgi:uncharacterized protein YacL
LGEQERKERERKKPLKELVKTVAQTSKQIRWAEIRKSMTNSLNIAFGLTIGLVWANVVTFGFAAMGLSLTSATANPVSWGLYVIAAFGVTFICLLGIYVTARWKETAENKEEVAEEKREVAEEEEEKERKK